ncbi:hypothetical protein F442_16693 [Phytophthora nicotianae P10297]|uniref:Uncharacterized protein n=3 Tax=Phytophthora nicotianae TaxID=4792 RepID=W2YJG5_PHYNI|nr:hypothetical protein L916_16292 [Phytophthora nicotianae]ETO65864.1 hypothetical protein F444_16879 [Phytophthora nicotianae P1976]ETP35066.1 hypothetical protein F442_16693 [Phytophthora nicotianae P10297]
MSIRRTIVLKSVEALLHRLEDNVVTGADLVFYALTGICFLLRSHLAPSAAQAGVSRYRPEVGSFVSVCH